MYIDKYVFSVLSSSLDRNHFNYLVHKYQANRYTKSFSCWNQLLAMMFGLLCNRDGLRDLVAAVEALDELGLRDKITVIGIAKRLEEIYFPGDSFPLYIDRNSESLRVVQRLRDEAHRFGITHHRKRRSLSQTRSELDNIKGVGEKTRTSLLSHFKSVKRIREASLDELSSIVGRSKAEVIKQYFEQNK